MEEAPARASQRLRDLDAHHAQGEQAANELGRNLRRVVHFPDPRADLPVRELVNALREELFVLGQGRQGRGQYRG